MSVIVKIISFAVFFFIISPCGAQTGDQLLQKHFDKTGQEIWNQIDNLTIDGRWVDENYYGHDLKITFKAPDKLRIQGKYQKKPFIEAFNGIHAWIVAPWKNKYEIQLMKPEEAVVLQNSFSLGSPLYKYRHKLKFIGLDDFEGTVYHTFVFENDKIKKTFYLGVKDSQLYLETIELKANNGYKIRKTYEKYRSYQGLLIPTAVLFKGEELEKELVFDEVVIGMGASDDLFEMPKGKK